MFAGIVEAVGAVTSPLDPGTGRLSLRTPALGGSPVVVGESLAVSGCCLTVVASQPPGADRAAADGGLTLTFDVMPETGRRTTLGRLRSGDPVNLERALRYQDPVGGHLVTGHVEATGRVTALVPEGNSVRCVVAAPPALLGHCVARGSIAIDGCALTVVTVGAAEFVVALIPHTRQVTIAGGYTVGSLVNLEADLVARYVQRLLAATGGLRAAP